MINIVICTILLSLCKTEVADSFITREYTLQEVLDNCSNVAFGRAESVDRLSQRVIVRLEENVKGESEFSHIKINVAMGHVRGKKTSPAMLMKKFKEGLPVIIFYRCDPASIDGWNIKGWLKGLGYVSGTWFQILGTDKTDKSGIWWNFTLIQIYMHRTFSGSTEEFQDVIRAALAGKKWAAASQGDVKVLVLMGNGVPPVQGEDENGIITATNEFLTLKTFNKVGQLGVAYQETNDTNLPGLREAHILWIGVDEIARDGYHLGKEAADRIKSFVRRGGVVIVSSQDREVEEQAGEKRKKRIRKDFGLTKYAGDIFESPNSIKPGTVHLGDTWTGWGRDGRKGEREKGRKGKDAEEGIKILATANNGRDIALATMQSGKGMYLVTALKNETEAAVEANAALMENIIHFSVKWLKDRSPSNGNVS